MRTSVPLYHHLKNSLMEEIQEGKWQPGEMVPSESELAKLYSVSRTTVRQAIGDLVSSGYLVRQQGKGTFVSHQRKIMTHSPLYGFAEELRQRGNDVEMMIERVDLIPCPKNVGQQLQQVSGDVILVSRTARTGNICMFREASYLVPPHQFAADELQQKQHLFDHVYGFLEQHGVKIGLAVQTVAAEQATTDDVAILNVSTKQPVLVIRRTTQDITGLPVEFSEVRYPGNLYKYEISLHR
jgi:GntR family transcriptional regulator, N-acetylglucosamine utilization regulator